MSDGGRTDLLDERLTRRELARRGGLGVVALGGVPSLLAACGGARPASQTATVPGKRNYGGTLRVGSSGASNDGSLDAQSNNLYSADIARGIQLFETLLWRDHKYKVQPWLAEEVSSDRSGQTWTIRLRSGVTFHDGSPLTADDVAFSLARVANPKGSANGAAEMAMVDPKTFRKMDKRTLRVPLRHAYTPFPDVLAEYYNSVVPVGYEPFPKVKPNGTGPFKFKSFQGGQQSTFVKNPDYWRSGEPYLDDVVITDFNDPGALLNALLSGQVDAIDALPLNLINTVKSHGNLAVLNSETGVYVPFIMRTDIAPFNDVRVRQAFRLMVNRPQTINVADAGLGRLGNDVCGIFDPAYDHSLPQRVQDLEQAKSLLRQAGREDLQVTLTTSSGLGRADLVPAAEAFAQQASGAGVKVNLKLLDSTAWDAKYLSWPFTQNWWYTRPYLVQAGVDEMPGAGANDTHWRDSRWTSLIRQAYRTVDTAQRTEIIHQAQTIEYDTGGHIIWGFANSVNAYSTRFTGFVPDPSGLDLSQYAFREVSLA